MAACLPANAGDFPDAFVKSAREYLTGDYLPKIERCLEQLSDEQIWWRGNEQSNSIGNLILHLCGNARQWIICGLGGEPDNRRRDQEFAQRGEISKADLLKFLKETLTRVDDVLAQLDTATLLEKRWIQEIETSVLDAVFHVTEHFSMHTGQIILLTKLLVNEDLRFYEFSAGMPIHRWKQTAP